MKQIAIGDNSSSLSFSGTDCKRSENERGPVRLENKKALAYVFGQPLRLPDYQRGYCWDDAHVKDLMESLWTADWTRPYHLGTIIIHCHPDEKGKEQWDVVDGQQRLVTLALLANALQCGNLVSSFLEANNTSDPDVTARLYANHQTIGEWIAGHPMPDGDNQQFREWLLSPAPGANPSGVCVSIVLIKGNKSNDNETLSIAWTFFDAINSGGKRLNDFDLLKAHHLRYLSKGEQSDEKESLIQDKAAKWDALGRESVESFNGKRPLFEQTLGQTLYLVRSWIRNRPIQVGALPGDGRYELLNQYSALTGFVAADLPMTGIQAGIVGGKCFFDWTERSLSQYRSFESHNAVRCFQCMPWKDAQIHLRIIARAAWFFYYSKFGDVCMADAIAFILYRLGKLRNGRCLKENWYGSNLVKHTIEALDESPTAECFFHYCQMPSNRYARYYNLKDGLENKNLAKSWRNGPEFWKKALALVSSSNMFGLHGLGQSVCYKRKVQALYGEIATDFKMALDENLALTDSK